MLRVLIVDDSIKTREALANWLDALGDFQVVGMAASEEEATQWLQRHRNKWDVAVVDLLTNGSGFTLIGRAKQSSSTGRVVIFSEHVTSNVAARCVVLGAAAAFNKSEPEKMLDYLGGLQGAGSFRRRRQ